MIESKTTEDTVLLEVEIGAPPERVFQALTRPEEVVAWWGEENSYRSTSWTADLRVGGQWRSEGKNADGRPFHVGGKFLVVDPPRKLSYTWEPSWAEWEKLPPTTVAIELEAKGKNKTQLKLTHSGFAGFAKARDDHQQGWAMVMGWLKAHVEKA
jgi:uncharacterized protein YndB with AHSA1/START domain